MIATKRENGALLGQYTDTVWIAAGMIGISANESTFVDPLIFKNHLFISFIYFQVFFLFLKN